MCTSCEIGKVAAITSCVVLFMCDTVEVRRDTYENVPRNRIKVRSDPTRIRRPGPTINQRRRGPCDGDPTPVSSNRHHQTPYGVDMHVVTCPNRCDFDEKLGGSRPILLYPASSDLRPLCLWISNHRSILLDESVTWRRSPLGEGT